jgi:hypothetical protein
LGEKRVVNHPPGAKLLFITYRYHHIQVQLTICSEIPQMVAIIRGISSGDRACDNERIIGYATTVCGKVCVRYLGWRMPPRAAAPGEPMEKINRVPVGITGQVILFLLNNFISPVTTGAMHQPGNRERNGAGWQEQSGEITMDRDGCAVFAGTLHPEKPVNAPESEENYE